MNQPHSYKTVVLLGGAGLVGMQVARQISYNIKPDTLVICALTKEEVDPAIERLKQEFPKITFHGEFGNLFVRKEFASFSRAQLTRDKKVIDQIFNDVYGPITQDDENVGQQNFLVQIIHKYKPDAVIDTVNTATGISYQDVKTSSEVVKGFKDELQKLLSEKPEDFEKKIQELAFGPLERDASINNMEMLDQLLISLAIPQLIRHVVLLFKAMVAVNTYAYIKVGTTGTGGMGINIPFTHGEDKPSFTLMAKTAVGFAHTGLLFLIARTPGPMMVKEIKPAAMIGYRKVDWRPIKKLGLPIKKWESKKEKLEKELVLLDEEKYQDFGQLNLVGIDTGENGFFSRGEFETITYLNLMEFVTPEEIASKVVYELCGSSTGKDVIAALDSAVIDPSYTGGFIRENAIEEMLKLEKEKQVPSIALGQLGPPQLSKLLYEVHLLEQFYKTIEELANDSSSEKLAKKLEDYVLKHTDIQQIITSLGIPILLSDGKTILRGPTISIPESKIHRKVSVNDHNIDEWAKKGWVDLRPDNMKLWQNRAKKILAIRKSEAGEGSAHYVDQMYPHSKIKTGEIVGWIFVNEFGGGRIR